MAPESNFHVVRTRNKYGPEYQLKRTNFLDSKHVHARSSYISLGGRAEEEERGQIAFRAVVDGVCRYLHASRTGIRAHRSTARPRSPCFVGRTRTGGADSAKNVRTAFAPSDAGDEESTVNLRQRTVSRGPPRHGVWSQTVSSVPNGCVVVFVSSLHLVVGGTRRIVTESVPKIARPYRRRDGQSSHVSDTDRI